MAPPGGGSAGTELAYIRQVCAWSSGCKYPLSSLLPAPLQKAGTRIGDAYIRVEGIGTWMLAFCVGYRTSAEQGTAAAYIHVGCGWTARAQAGEPGSLGARVLESRTKDAAAHHRDDRSP